MFGSPVNPLRNSKGANTPFRSPFRAGNRPPQIDKSPLDKRPRLDGPANMKHKDEVSTDPMEILKQRISEKRKTVEDLKRKVLYKQKHNPKDLKLEIEKWRRGCQEALERFHNDVQERSEKPLTMSEILASLDIPEKLVKYSAEESTFLV